MRGSDEIWWKNVNSSGYNLFTWLPRLPKLCRFILVVPVQLEDCKGFPFPYNNGHQMQYYIGVLTSFPQNKHFRQKWKETKHWKSFFQFVLILSFLWLISFYNILIWSKQTAKWWKHLYNQFVILLNISNPGILFWHKITQFRSRAECMEIHKYSESDLHSSSYSNLPNKITWKTSHSNSFQKQSK